MAASGTTDMNTPTQDVMPRAVYSPKDKPEAWQYKSIKQEPVENRQRNDSGINSESDRRSSSPGSDNVPCVSPKIGQLIAPALDCCTAAPFLKMRERYNNRPEQSYENDHNVLSPPNSEHFTSPNSPHSVTLTNSNVEVKREVDVPQTALTPCASPEEAASHTSTLSDISNIDDPVRGLKRTTEKNGLPLSVALFSEENDPQPSHYTPKLNANGKIKTFRCKQCSFQSVTKENFWEHTKEHISIEKRLTCPQCPFVTEYKHHMEYHLRIHSGSKPFKCDQCSYACVNKSMLNSHLKSHSNVHQYRCADCHYKTKYCHSLKKHLRTANHNPAMVLNPDGTPNPLPIIDVYGSRRGPKAKNQKHMPVAMEQPSLAAAPIPPFLFNYFAQNLENPFPTLPLLPALLTNQLALQNLENCMRGMQGLSSAQEAPPQPMETEEEALDLSKPVQCDESAPEHEDVSDDEGLTTMFSNVEAVVGAEASANEENSDTGNNIKDDYKCRFCNMSFGDSILYTMHMGYHGYNNPFACNMCGEVCEDKISFFVHIARSSHS